MSRSVPRQLLQRIMAAFAVAALCAGAPAVAAPAKDAAGGLPDRTNAMRVSVVRDATPGCVPSCTEWIAAQGKIVPETRAAFERVLRSVGDRKLPVFIDSIGGSVPDAIAIGRAIRSRHLDVVVTRTAFEGCGDKGGRCGTALPAGVRAGRPQGIGAVCASSCTLILAGGEKREVAPWTLVGVHQIIVKQTMTRVERVYRVVSRQVQGVKVVLSRTLVDVRPLSTFNVTRKPSPETYRTVASYLSDMGVGPGLMPLMLSTPPTGIHWVSASEGASTGLVTDRVDGEYVAAESARVANDALRGGDGAASPATGVPEEAIFMKADAVSGQPQTSVGRVTWTLDGSPDPAKVVLRADVEVPDTGVHLALRMSRPNGTSSVTAPVIDLAFATAPSGSVRSVEAVDVPQAGKLDDAERFALAGTVRPRGANAFQVSLSDDLVKSNGNEAVVQGQPWLGIPMLVDGGTRAVIMVRHDSTGGPLIAQAFKAWKTGASQASIPPAGLFTPRS